MPPFDALTAVELAVFFVVGLSLGSFLNVCGFRIARRESIVHPGSHCLECNSQIGLRDNIPILSYVLLRGRCRFCKAKLSLQYPLVEGLMGLLCVFIALGVGLDIRTLHHGPMAPRVIEAMMWLSFSFFIVLLAVIDHQTGLVPDVVSLPGIVAGLVFITLLWATGGGASAKRLVRSPFARSPLDSLVGLVIVGGIFFLIVFVSKGRLMGGGDIRIGALFGTFLGWELGVLSILIASIAGTARFTPSLLRGRVSRKTEIRFAPLLSFGAIVSSFFGKGIIDWYFRNFWA